MDEQDPSEARALAGRYELGPLLGHGGMGAVHDAVDLRLRRPVAVKVLRTDLAAQPKVRRRFETEARTAARLVHPNVVTVFDSGEQHGIPYLVMERLPGRTLADEFAAGPVSVERVRAVAGEILAALAAAHAAGIIHRDIKPGNALLTLDGHVKVSDFGIAKTVDDIDQTQTVELIATPGYLAPERLAGEPASQRSDLYSVGVLLYEALAGRRPFAGDTPLAVMRAVEAGRAEPLASLRPSLPADVIAVVERAMSRDPSRRFASAAEMAVALEPRPHLDATRKLELPVPLAVVRRSGRPGARRRLLAIGVGTAFVGALLAGVVASQHNQGRPATSLSSTTTSAPPPTTGLAAATTTSPPRPGRGHSGDGPGKSKKGNAGNGGGN